MSRSLGLGVGVLFAALCISLIGDVNQADARHRRGRGCCGCAGDDGGCGGRRHHRKQRHHGCCGEVQKCAPACDTSCGSGCDVGGGKKYEGSRSPSDDVPPAPTEDARPDKRGADKPAPRSSMLKATDSPFQTVVFRR